ncbi:hypothetical protein [Urechidicola sp. KH5]
MNKEPKDKLDQLTKKMVKALPEETPSLDFSFKVMDAIYDIEESVVLQKSKPLISKSIWALILTFVGAACIYLFHLVGTEESTIGKYVPEFSLQIPSLEVSNITLYSFVVIGIMMAIQFGFIRNYYIKN